MGSPGSAKWPPIDTKEGYPSTYLGRIRQNDLVLPTDLLVEAPVRPTGLAGSVGQSIEPAEQQALHVTRAAV
jgi:hypothetical protein